MSKGKSKKKPAKNTKPAAAPAAAKPRPPKQLGMGEGFDRKTIAEIDDAAAQLRATRTKRLELQEREATEQATVLELMQRNGLKKYIYVDAEGEQFDVELDDKIKVKVRKHKADDAGEE